MRNEILPIVLAVILSSAGIGPGIVFAQSISTQNQRSQAVQNEDAEEQGEKQEGAEGREPANEQYEEQNLPGGGHQDPDGANVKHQFEGIE